MPRGKQLCAIGLERHLRTAVREIPAHVVNLRYESAMAIHRDKRTLLITGAKGTVGRYAVSLAESEGWRVIATDLDTRGLRAPIRGEIRAHDLRDFVGLRDLVRGADAVLHTAAIVNVREAQANLAQVNSQAVAALFEAAASEGVSRFVHLSTGTLYQPAEGTLNESARLAPEAPYSMSKLGAELFFQGARHAEPAFSVLRPAPIYGRRGRHFGAALLAVGPLLRLLAPRLPRPKGGAQLSMVHAEDVASAALFVLSSNPDDVRGQAFNVADESPLSLGDRLMVTFDAYGLKTLPVPSPPGVLFDRLADLASGSLANGLDLATLAGWRRVIDKYDLKPALRPRFDPEILADLRRRRVLDTSRLSSLGWRPRFADFKSGFAQVLKWYQAERWVPRYDD